MYCSFILYVLGMCISTIHRVSFIDSALVASIVSSNQSTVNVGKRLDYVSDHWSTTTISKSAQVINLPLTICQLRDGV